MTRHRLPSNPSHNGRNRAAPPVVTINAFDVQGAPDHGCVRDHGRGDLVEHCRAKDGDGVDDLVGSVRGATNEDRHVVIPIALRSSASHTWTPPLRFAAIPLASSTVVVPGVDKFVRETNRPRPEAGLAHAHKTHRHFVGRHIGSTDHQHIVGRLITDEALTTHPGPPVRAALFQRRSRRSSRRSWRRLTPCETTAAVPTTAAVRTTGPPMTPGRPALGPGMSGSLFCERFFGLE